MKDFAKLTNAYCQVEDAAEVLRDLLGDEQRGPPGPGHARCLYRR